MTEGRPDFREMTQVDLPDGVRLSRASGWNQTAADWRRLLELGPGLFRVAVEEGHVVASAGAVRYGGDLAWICMVLVDPAARGRGLGTAIFDEVLAFCQAEVSSGRLRAVGLDATPGGRPIYRRGGFVDGPALVRMRAEPRGEPLPDTAAPCSVSDLEEILTFDADVFGADRSALLRWALEAAPDMAWLVRSSGRVAGYCFGRHGEHSDHIGPVVAEDAKFAVDLVRAGLSSGGDRPVIVDARVEANWVRALSVMGFREQRPFTRMYLRGVEPRARPSREPAVFGPEFG